MKRKGKVHPSPSSTRSAYCSSSSSSSPVSCSTSVPSSSSSASINRYIISRFNLLPPTLRSSAFSLPSDDREVLAYLITRSVDATTTTSTFYSSTGFTHSRRKNTRLQSNLDHNKRICNCFDCYASFWRRWDSSPNREQIHHVIEAFDDYLTGFEESRSTAVSDGFERSESNLSASPGKISTHIAVKEQEAEEEVHHPAVEERRRREDIRVNMFTTSPNSIRGFARKMLPDFLGLLNWRFWGFWKSSI